MSAQYKLPDAQAVHDRKLAHLERVGIEPEITQRREGSPWHLVREER